MVGEKKDKAPAQQARLMYICPQCGKTVDMSRRYCDCHADVRQASVTASTNLPEVKPCNFESPGLNCGDCPEDCMYCPSFGEPQKNSTGFGGKDCKYFMTGKAKCYCCQAQVKILTDWRANKVSFSRLVRGVLEGRRAKGEPEDAGGKNIWLEAADVIRNQMEKPVLDRIQQKLDQAG
jgi:hypothetical protein